MRTASSLLITCLPFLAWACSPQESGTTATSNTAPPVQSQPQKKAASVVDEITPLSIQRALQPVDATVVGKVDPPFPAGCSDQGGGLVASTEDRSKLLGSQVLRCESAMVFWLQESVSTEPLSWRVLDVLKIPDEAGRGVLQVHDGCEYPKQRGELIVVGRWNPTEGGGQATDISSAWIVADDFSDRSFRAIEDLSEVTCGYDEDRD